MTDTNSVVLKSDAMLCLYLLQFIERLEVTIGDGLIGERPQSFAGLQFWRVGRQKDKMDASWDNDFPTFEPARSIEYQDDVPIRTSANRLRELGESNAEDLDVYRREQEPLTLPQFGMHEPVHVEPFIPVLYPNNRAMPSERPDAPDDGLEAHAMLVHSPQLYLGSRMGLLNLLDLFGELALERLLLRWIGFVMTWSGNLEGEAHSLEILPAALRMDCSSELLAHPTGNFRTSPQATIRRSLLKEVL